MQLSMVIQQPLKLLLDYGAAKEIENTDEQTPLFYAVQEGHRSMVKLSEEKWETS